MKSVRFYPDKNLEDDSPNLLVIENQPKSKGRNEPHKSHVDESLKKSSTKHHANGTQSFATMPPKEITEVGVVKMHDMETQEKVYEQHGTVYNKGSFQESPLYKSSSPPADKDTQKSGLNFMIDKFRNMRNEHSVFSDFKRRLSRTLDAKTEKKGDVSITEPSNQSFLYFAPSPTSNIFGNERHCIFSNNENVSQNFKSEFGTSSSHHVEKGEECYEDAPADSYMEKTENACKLPSEEEEEFNCMSSQNVHSMHYSDCVEHLDADLAKADMAVTLSSLKAKDSLETDLAKENDNYDSLPSLHSSDVCDTFVQNSINEVIIPHEEKTYLEKLLLLIFERVKCFFIWKKMQLFFFFPLVITLCAIIPFLPVTSYFKGLLSGICVSLIIKICLWSLHEPPKEKKPFIFSECPFLPPLTTLEHSKKEPILYKGWMNEFCGEYNPKLFRMSTTQSVYVRLEGTILRLSFPKKNIPYKAMWNEPEPELHFINQIHYDILGAKVSLVPPGLIKTTRLWKRNYPILLTILNIHKKRPVLPVKKTLSSEHHENEDDSSKDVIVRSLSSVSIPPKHIHSVAFYLFARTNKEKEEWYHRFSNAASGKVVKFSSLNGPVMLSQQTDEFNAESATPQEPDKSNEECTQPSERQPLDNCMDPSFKNKLPSQLKFENDSSTIKDKGTPSSTFGNVFWLNIFFARIFSDFLAQKHWSEVITVLMQKKLNRIKVPTFMNKLQVSDVCLGTSLPIIQKVYPPTSDLRGLWINLVIEYSGSFQMTLETKVNINHLQKSTKKTNGNLESVDSVKEHKETRLCDDYEEEEDEEDSEAFSLSSDEQQSDLGDSTAMERSAGIKTGAKVVKFLEKIAQSHYFQQVTENAYLKKAIEGVSNTPLILTVEVLGLYGTLTLNIPPPPSDRLWYGFQKNPMLSISARPKLGEIEVNLAHVTEWIENKMISEFQNLLILPNMDDIRIPILQSSFAE